ncbi:MAG: phosphoribosylformylglycinamidine synthase II, partial [Candidatus Sulfotelmatobacter sp.]
AKGIGARVTLASGGLPAEFVLFGEDASRILLSCDAGKVEGIQRVAGKFGVAADVIGETGSDRVEISLDGAVVVSAAVGELSGDYEGALEAALRAESVAVEA